MAYKKYVKSFSLYLFVLFFMMALLAYILVAQHWFLTSVIIALFIFLMMRQILKKTETTNQRLNLFFQRINSDESSISFPAKKEGFGFDELSIELNNLSKKLNLLQESKKRDQELFRAILQNLNVGVFLMDAHQKIVFSNPIAQTFLNIRTAADYQKIKERAPHFTQLLDQLRDTNKIQTEISDNGETQRWQVQRSRIKHEEDIIELFLVNNLQAEMENKELEVTEKLMHTLTHEIMNSISPLTSLSETLQLQLNIYDETADQVCILREDFNDLQTTAKVISKRGLGLIEFVERYSLLARLPRLKMERISGDDIMEELHILMQAELSKSGIHLSTLIENKRIFFRADKQLLLQVLINLIKNAMEAYEGKRDVEIKINLSKGDGYNYISITDMAGGIDLNIRKNIFLPFFSTKTKGSGIGLSLSRKIIHAHYGRLYYRAIENGSEFRIELMD